MDDFQHIIHSCGLQEAFKVVEKRTTCCKNCNTKDENEEVSTILVVNALKGEELLDIDALLAKGYEPDVEDMYMSKM